MFRPKWYKNTYQLKVGDMLLFLKNESCLKNVYQYGMVTSTEPSRDGVVRKVRVRYQNFNEQSTRETYRSACKLVLIHSIDELDLMNELYTMGVFVDNLKKELC